MTDLVGLLSDYGQVQPRRAHGGIYALAGFNYQLRAYVARLVESLGRDDQTMEDAGQVFVEALSDLAEHTGDDKLIFIQAKRTLTGAALKDAADELLAIDRFLQQTHPEWHAKTHFELIASQGKPLGWTDLPASHPAHTTVQRLLAEDRLRPPRIEPDPGWRAIAAVWNTLNDPYGFVRFALDRALGRTTSADDAQRVRDDICERYAEHRRTAAYPGSLLTEQDFVPNPHPSPTLEIGREITLARLRDQQYMPRPHRRDATLASLLTREDLRHRDLQCAARVFWLAGRSGVGKSVLLLQVVERLVLDGRRVLWLGGHAEHLEPALRALADAPADLCPEFIAIDDLYDRDARTRLDLESLGTFIDECGYRVWPLILSCGPAEFAEAFEEDSRYRGFEVHRETVQPIAESETHEIEDWYRHRTEREPLRGAAFEQTHEADGGLFISLAVELTHGDLRQFAQRFSDRVRINKLEEALRLPLALNRLYLRAPYDWLSEADREKLASLNMDGDFRLLDAGQAGQIIRLTHPHLADALYRALRKPANAEAYTNDLVAIFQRALDESDTNLVLQLLRLFSAQRHGLAGERLTITDEALLADRCAKAWKQHPTLALDADGTAVAATSWACWARQQPRIETLLGSNLATDALATLNDAPSVWPYCWMQLATGTSQQPALVAWASKHLSDPLRLRHPMWSRIWEHCLTISADTGPWRTLGLDWLQCRLRRPDWHYVWKKLLPAPAAADWQNDPILILGQRRLHAERDGLDWAYVLEDLFPLATPDGALARELAILGLDWLAGREERAEWSYVWRTLLSDTGALPPSLPIADLLGLGHAWLMGREERPEWTHVWQALLHKAEALPPSLPLADLLALGHAWLTGREEQAEWAHIWQDLVANTHALPSSLPLTDLLQQGFGWLQAREVRDEWGFVCEALLDRAYAEHAFIETAALWLVGAGKNKRSWPILAAKFIVTAPQHPASRVFAVKLTHRLNASVNNGQWKKIEPLLDRLEAFPTAVPLEILNLHQSVANRKASPAWEIARQLKADNRTVQGTITAVKTDFCAVELAIGLLARWPQRNNGLSRTANGLQKAFFIQQITPDKDYVEVSTEKPQRIEAGRIYEGQVIEQRDYGLIIDVDAQRGLLHCSQCINFGALRARHPKGSTIRVKVLREKDKGLELTVADDETTQTEEEKTVQIGGRADAVIRGIQEYGLFVRIGKHNGLIHRSTFSGGKAFKPSDYSVGTEIRVQVVGIRADGKLELAPAEQSPDGCRAAPRTGRRG